jgi:hypothetical protein
MEEICKIRSSPADVSGPGNAKCFYSSGNEVSLSFEKESNLKKCDLEILETFYLCYKTI